MSRVIGYSYAGIDDDGEFAICVRWLRVNRGTPPPEMPFGENLTPGGFLEPRSKMYIDGLQTRTETRTPGEAQ